MTISNRLLSGAALGAVFLSIHCSSPPTSEPAGETTTSAMSSHIPSNGTYGMTAFGGDGDRQPTSCGGNTGDMQSGNARWYVASSQRYGCHRHLKLTRGSKCLVVQTVDAGPADFVEENAGIPVMDSSPAVARYFFGSEDIGWQDIANNPGSYTIKVSTTSSPVGACSGGGGSDDDDPPNDSCNDDWSCNNGGGSGGGRNCDAEWNECSRTCDDNDNDCWDECDAQADECDAVSR